MINIVGKCVSWSINSRGQDTAVGAHLQPKHDRKK